MNMNKKELAEVIKGSCDCFSSKVEAERIVERIFTEIAIKLAKKEEVSISGFGKFVTAKRKARMGRNPMTGAEIKIPASTVAKFKPSKALKEAVNK